MEAIEQLRARVRALEAEVRRERARARADELRGELTIARGELLMGDRPFRTEPPTPAELAAQHARGGGWRVEDIRGSVQNLRGTAINPRFLGDTKICGKLVAERVPLRWRAENELCALDEWPEALRAREEASK